MATALGWGGAAPQLTPVSTVRPASTTAAARPVDPDRKFIVGAWFLAFLIPFIGFICGIILTARRRHGHGVWLMIAAFVWPLLVFLFFFVLNSAAARFG